MRFWKYHGLGNDFVLVEEEVTGEQARALCDRRRGVGGDGVLVLSAGVAPDADGAVTVWNSDGSMAEICGNGLRCVSLHLADRAGPEKKVEEVRLETGAGTTRCRVLEHPGSGRAVVEVEMGRPTLRREEVPVAGGGGRMIEEDVEVDGRRYAVTAVSMGNPHAVIFGQHTLEEVRAYGTLLEHHALFPAGVNAGFATMAGEGRIDLTVWERGAGLTGACGSGACAAAVAACVTERAAFGEPLLVRQPGGDLTITVPDLESSVTMRGPARGVFVGEVDLDALR